MSTTKNSHPTHDDLSEELARLLTYVIVLYVIPYHLTIGMRPPFRAPRDKRDEPDYLASSARAANAAKAANDASANAADTTRTSKGARRWRKWRSCRSCVAWLPSQCFHLLLWAWRRLAKPFFAPVAVPVLWVWHATMSRVA